MEDIQAFDEGNESTPTVNGEETATAEETPKVDSAEETKTDESTESEEKSAEGEKVSEESSEEAPKVEEGEQPKTADELLSKLDEEIADEKHPAYYRNGLKLYKDTFLAKTGEIEKVYEPLKRYGEVEKITENLELITSLDAFEPNPVTNLPEATARPFVTKLIDKKGIEKAVDVMMELGKVKSPTNSNWNLFSELIAANGLDPDRISDYKVFKANGYQIANASEIDPDELALIPEDLREAYRYLTASERLKIAPSEYDDETDVSARNRLLQAVKSEMDVNRQKAADAESQADREKQEQAEKQREFQEAWNTRTDEITNEEGNRLRTTFVESLVKDVEMDEFDALAVASLLSFALNDKGADAQMSRAALEKMGVTLDPAIDTLYAEWQKTASDAAFFDKQGDKTNYAVTANHLRDLTDSLIRKGNPIIAAIAEYRANKEASKITKNNDLLTQTQTDNGINKNEGQPATVLGATNGFEPGREVKAFE